MRQNKKSIRKFVVPEIIYGAGVIDLAGLYAASWSQEGVDRYWPLRPGGRVVLKG